MSMYDIKLVKLSEPYIGSQNDITHLFRLGTFDLLGRVSEMELSDPSTPQVKQICAHGRTTKWGMVQLEKVYVSLNEG